MTGYTIQIAMLVLLGVLALSIYFIQSRHGAVVKQKHRWVSYLLLWPLILDANKEKRGGKAFTTREWLGLALIALFIACGVVFFS